MHDDRHAQLFGKFRAAVHLFRGWSGHVQVVTFTFTGFTLGTVNGFRHVFETVTPAHERLGVNVLVILGEIQTTAKPFITGAAIVFR